MIANGFNVQRVAAGWMLIASMLIFMVGALMYTGRAIFHWPAAQAYRYLLWERGIVMAALLTLIAGLVVLERMLEAAGDQVFAPVGMVVFLIGSALILVAETLSLSGQAWADGPTILFVVLAFVGQAVLGAAVLRTGLLPGWVGWFAILWSLLWLVVLPIARPRDMYYPWLHYIVPLATGIALLVKK